jgi:hypothetical protein
MMAGKKHSKKKALAKQSPTNKTVKRAGPYVGEPEDVHIQGGTIHPSPRKEQVKVSDIVGALCGWASCSAMAPYGAGGLVPEGWRSLVVTKYSLLEPSGVLNAEVDMMLCPDHVQALSRLLKGRS